MNNLRLDIGSDNFIQSESSVPFWIDSCLATVGLNSTVPNLQDHERVTLPNELLLQSLSSDYLHLEMPYIFQVRECVRNSLKNTLSIHV